MALGAIGILAMTGCETTSTSVTNVDGMNYKVTAIHVEDLRTGKVTTTYAVDELGIDCATMAECKRMIQAYHKRVVQEEDPAEGVPTTPGDPIADSRGD